eukprot:1274452-Amphidinium_carterae.2
MECTRVTLSQRHALLPRSSGVSLDELEDWCSLEQVVLYDMHAINKMQHLGLASSTAVHHATDLGSQPFRPSMRSARIPTSSP